MNEFLRVVNAAVEKFGVPKVAEIIGVSYPTVERWLAGKSAPHSAVEGTVVKVLTKEMSDDSVGR